jgi:hypothetical protein
LDKLFGKGLEIIQMSGDYPSMVRQKPDAAAVAGVRLPTKFFHDQASPH